MRKYAEIFTFVKYAEICSTWLNTYNEKIGDISEYMRDCIHRIHIIPLPSDESTLLTGLSDRLVQLKFRDTYVEEEYDRMRPLFYPGTHVFVLCVSSVERNTVNTHPIISNSDSIYNSVKKFWYEEFMRCGYGDVPVILLITKCDLVSSSSRSDDELCQILSAKTFTRHRIMVSVNDKKSITRLVRVIVDLGMEYKPKSWTSRKRSQCSVLWHYDFYSTLCHGYEFNYMNFLIYWHKFNFRIFIY